MAATTRGRPPRITRPAAPDDAPSPDPPMDLLPAAVAADLAPVLAALTRTVQAALDGAAGAIGRAGASRNGTLVSLGAAREDVEILRAFLAAQPLPPHIHPEE